MGAAPLRAIAAVAFAAWLAAHAVACSSSPAGAPDAGAHDDTAQDASVSRGDAAMLSTDASGSDAADAANPDDGEGELEDGGPVLGGPGCGLAAAAFCETFDAPAVTQGRAGELDVRWWSGSRLAPQGPTTSGEAFGVAAATLQPTRTLDGGAMQLPACRSGLAAQTLPDQDALICAPSPTIQSSHLLVAVAAQNYGANSYRIRQPFDFTGRTGTLVFDAEALAGGLLGWISVEVTSDPIGVPGFSLGQGPSPYPNDEGTPLPKNGFELQFNGASEGGALSLFATFQDYAETDYVTNQAPVATAWGKLNRFEVHVSETLVEVFASPASDDGTTFGPKTKIFSQAASLGFSRGWVHVTTHDHGSLKYTASGSGFGDGFTDLDAWIARWDNVGFDGPVVGGWREYEVGDALVPFTVVVGDDRAAGTPEMNLGWTLPDASSGSSTTLHFHGVDPSGMTTARIALTSWYCLGCTGLPAMFDLRWRLNGGAWHDRLLEPGELAFLTGGASQGALAQMLEVSIGELVAGDNTLDLATANVPQNYPPGVTNVDLILSAP